MTDGGLHSAEAQAVVPGDAEVVFDGIVALVERLWAMSVRTILSERPVRLMHSVSGGDEAGDVWLTWELRAADASTTRVRLVHEEADTSAGPPAELEAVLGLLKAAQSTAGSERLAG
jgi:methanogenic corrinoid protein MtbC1